MAFIKSRRHHREGAIITAGFVLIRLVVFFCFPETHIKLGVYCVLVWVLVHTTYYMKSCVSSRDDDEDDDKFDSAPFL